MTEQQAMRLALEALENSVDLVMQDAYNAEQLYGNYPARQAKVGGLKLLAEDHQKAITALRQALEQQPADELLRLRDLLGKANALARIRANEIESLKASLYGLYKLEKQRDELQERLIKTEDQLGEAVWNYGELKREQLANQQKTSGSPINPLTDVDKIRNACPRTYNRCGYDAVAKKCVAEGCAGPQNWAVFCGGCRKEWTVPYQHPGKSICTECEAKLKATTDTQTAAWVGLDRKEMLTIIDQQQANTSTGLPMFYRDQCMDIARAIEAALRSKNT